MKAVSLSGENDRNINTNYTGRFDNNVQTPANVFKDPPVKIQHLLLRGEVWNTCAEYANGDVQHVHQASMMTIYDVKNPGEINSLWCGWPTG